MRLARWSALLVVIGLVVVASLSRASSAVSSGADTTLVDAQGPDTALRVVAQSDFENGTIAPFFARDTHIVVVADPSNSGHGKVARIHYKGVNQDANFYLGYTSNIKLGDEIDFEGDLYLPPGINTDPFFGRKLTYWQRANEGSFPQFWSIVVLFGTELKFGNGYVDRAGGGHESQTGVLTKLEPGRWYHLKQVVRLNTTYTSNDGLAQLWLDGQLIAEFKNFSWSSPDWTQPPSAQAFKNFLFGEQVNYGAGHAVPDGAFDEYRYWDNVVFRVRRLP